MQSIYANGAADGDYMVGHWRITGVSITLECYLCSACL